MRDGGEYDIGPWGYIVSIQRLQHAPCNGSDGRIDPVISLPDIALRCEGCNFNFGVTRQNADKLKPRIAGSADDRCSHMVSPLNKKKEGL